MKLTLFIEDTSLTNLEDFTSIPLIMSKLNNKTILNIILNTLEQIQVSEMKFVVSNNVNVSELTYLCQKLQIENYTIIQRNKLDSSNIYVEENTLILLGNHYFNLKLNDITFENLKKNTKLITTDTDETIGYFCKKLVEKTTLEDFLNLKDFDIKTYSKYSVTKISLDTLNKLDINYYKNNNMKNNHILYLKSNMQFEELSKYYEELLLKTDRYILEHIICVAELGQLDRLLELINKNDLEKLISNDYYVCSDNEKINDLISYTKIDENGKKYIDFIDTLGNEVYHKLFLEEKFDIAKFVNENTVPFFFYGSDNLWITGLIRLKAINILFDRKMVNEHLLGTFTIALNRYSVFSQKNLITIILKYVENFLPDYLLTRESDGHVAKYSSALFAHHYDEYKPGIKKYVKKLYNLRRITNETGVTLESYIPLNIINKRPKVALCLTGASRGNLELQLKDHMAKIIEPLSKDADVDVYVYTWDEHYPYPGPGSQRNDDGQWYRKCFGYLHKEIPSDIDSTPDFKKRLPKTADTFINPRPIENKKEFFSSVIPNVTIKFGNQKEFEDKYDKYDAMKTDGNLVQSKMFFGHYNAIKMAIDSGKEYDYIMKNRIDYGLMKPLEYSQIEKIAKNELAVVPTHVFGVMDGVFIGKPNVVFKMAQIWEMIEKTNIISPLLHAGIELNRDAEHLTYDWMSYNKIYPNTSLGMAIHISLSAVNLEIPKYQKDLEDDLSVIPKEEHEQYIKFFKRIEETNK